MLLNDSKEFKIQYDEELRLMRIEWMTTAEIRRLLPALDQLVQLVERIGVTHVLLALESLPDLSAYDQIWIGTHWMPRVLKLPLQQAVIVLHPNQIYNQHAIETIIKLSRPFIKFDIHFFNQSTAGMHWLLEGSPHQEALLREWEADYGPRTRPPGEVAEPFADYRA